MAGTAILRAILFGSVVGALLALHEPPDVHGERQLDLDRDAAPAGPACPCGHNSPVKIQLMSDLHLESQPGFQATPAPGADLLVLAGDIGSYQRGSLLADDDFGLERFSPQRGWPVPVLYVPGNQ